jgi:hypothetical protein
VDNGAAAKRAQRKAEFECRLRQEEEGSMAFWLALLLVNLVMGFLIGYCFRAANEPGRKILHHWHREIPRTQYDCEVEFDLAPSEAELTRRFQAGAGKSRRNRSAAKPASSRVKYLEIEYALQSPPLLIASNGLSQSLGATGLIPKLMPRLI